jgi:hypothetical protein
MIMKATSHAPWKAEFGRGGWVVLSARGEGVVYVRQDIIHDEANARLIAAAPELLAALDGIMQWWMETESGDDMPMDLFDRAHDAIAKAKP